MSSGDVLVVAGEASGDRAAARVVARLHARGTRTFGLGGHACAAAGMEMTATSDAAMGVVDVVRRAGRILSSMYALRAAVKRRRPRVALLVNYTEFNARLLGFLRHHEVRSVWYAAPQIWAWRPGRGTAIARDVDAMAVVLPFEEPLWRALGANVRYVGHPVLEVASFSRAAARRELALDDDPKSHAIALLPGSRAPEIARLLPSMLAAISNRRDATRLLLTRALPARSRSWARSLADAAGVRVHEIDAENGAFRVLAAFDASLCASGTASLEATLASAPPIVAYRVDRVAAIVAHHLIRTPHIALPNAILGRRAFPELLQENATAARMRTALDAELEPEARSRALASCVEVRRMLDHGDVPSRAVTDMISQWL